MVWKEKFLRFLKEEGVYSEWVYNIYEQHHICDKKFWECTLKSMFNEKRKCSDCINYAFCWGRTKQGNDFWLKLDEKWKCKCGYYYHYSKCCGEEDFYDF